jgi:hypothetical protein
MTRCMDTKEIQSLLNMIFSKENLAFTLQFHDVV